MLSSGPSVSDPGLPGAAPTEALVTDHFQLLDKLKLFRDVLSLMVGMTGP